MKIILLKNKILIVFILKKFYVKSFFFISFFQRIQRKPTDFPRFHFSKKIYFFRKMESKGKQFL
jgi:hypothetical protein